LSVIQVAIVHTQPGGSIAVIESAKSVAHDGNFKSPESWEWAVALPIEKLNLASRNT
jgi:hypothetical protein